MLGGNSVNNCPRGIYADFNTPNVFALSLLFARFVAGAILAGFTSAGWAIVAGRTPIIPIKVSPNEINPNTTAVSIVKFPVAKSNIAVTAQSAHVDQ
jgi:hypothetical protein